MAVHIDLLRQKFDHLNGGVEVLNEAINQRFPAELPITFYLNWKQWAVQWHVYYAEQRPTDVLYGDDDDWRALSVQEQDFMAWRKRYQEVTGEKAPPYELSATEAPTVTLPGTGLFGELSDLALPVGLLLGAYVLSRNS